MRCSLLVCVVYITREWPFHHTSHESSWMSELQSATGSFQANFISRLSWGIKEFGGHSYMMSSLLSYIVTPPSHTLQIHIGEWQRNPGFWFTVVRCVPLKIDYINLRHSAVIPLYVFAVCVIIFYSYASSTFPQFLPPPLKWGWRHMWMTLGTIANYSCFILCFIPAIHTADSLRIQNCDRLILPCLVS